MAVAVIAAYLLGSIPFALLLARRVSGVDLRRAGSGNLGAANVMRVSGVRTGVLVAILDIAKGAAAVTVARSISADTAVPAMAGLAAIIGHIYPVWLRFRGGKGVATACGVFALLTPIALLPAVAVFMLTVWLTRYMSLASLLATVVLPPVAYVAGSPRSAVAAAVAASTIIVFRHRANVARLRLGTERRFGAHL